MREMKDSGVEWLGCMPMDYDTASIGSLFTIKKDIIGHEPETVLSITQTGVKPKDLTSNEGQNASSYANYQIVNIGDFAMNHMDLLTGWIDISKYEGVTSPDYRVFTLNDKEMCAEYFLRVFQHYYTNKVFFGFGQGVATLGRWRLPAINFKKIDIPIPPIEEQQKIVCAIDENIGKIEELKANVQKQIEKLKAYKQSLITEVVTKGLNHTVSMKDSGVDWIGQMPMSWCLIRLKYLLSVKSGDAIRNELLSDEGVVPVYGGGEMIGYTSNANVPEGSILIGRVGARCGCITLPEGMAWATDNALIVNSTVNRKYLYYLLMASNLNRLNTSNAQPLITGGKIREATVPFTVLDSEQLEIVNYLDDKCKCIDNLIAIKQSKIEKLEQYKRSIIYEYVTGKKEVS